MRFYLTWATALFFVLAAVPTRAADWSVDIVPVSSTGKGEQAISVISLSRPFYVVLTNTSGHDLIAWKEWCSWGYFNLSFEFTGKDGKVVKVEKNRNQVWGKNGPDGFVVMPGKHFVLSVILASRDKTADKWTGAEKLDEAMTMKAIYKNTNEAFPGEKQNPQNKFPDDMQKLIDSAWVGQVESEPMQVTILR